MRGSECLEESVKIRKRRRGEEEQGEVMKD